MRLSSCEIVFRELIFLWDCLPVRSFGLEGSWSQITTFSVRVGERRWVGSEMKIRAKLGSISSEIAYWQLIIQF